MATANMSLNEPTVGQTTGPTWATETNSNWESIDTHDHTSGKGVQLTPSSLNINADVEFNLNSATELKNVVLDNTVHSSASGDTNVSLYAFDGNLYYRNASGVKVQITSGSAVDTTGGSISGMTSDSQVLFSSNSFAFKFDKSLPDPGMAKMSFADIDLYKYDASGSAAKVALKFLGSGTTATLTVPDETGTLLSTATSFAGTINIATSTSNAPIILKPNGSGHVTIGNGGATGKLTSNGAYDLILDTNGGTNSSSIAITDAANGNISLIPNGSGEIVIGSGSASGKITTNSTQDLVLDTNAGTNSGSITITDAADGNISFTPNGTGEIVIGSGSASGKITSNGAYDLVLDTNSGTNSGSITITDAADGNISFTPNGTGEIVIGSGSASGKITSSGAHDLVLDTNAGTNSGSITITDGADGNIAITPNGTGEVDISKVDIDGGAIDGVTIGTNSVVTDLRVDNLKLDGNTISSTNTDGDIDISPNGTGSIDLNSGTLDLSAQATVDVILNTAVDAINFDSNTLSIDASNNRIGIGTAAPGAQLNLALAGEPKILFSSFTTNAGSSGVLAFERSNDGSIDTNTAVDSGDYLGVVQFRGANGSGYNTGAEIVVNATETHSGSAAGTKMDFYTVNNTTTTKVKRLTIREDGNIAIGDQGHPARRLSIKGTANDNSENTVEVLNSDDTQLLVVRSDGYIRMTSIPFSGDAANMVIDGGGFVYRPSSSRRFKNNIVDTAKGLTDLLNLRAVDFNSICPNDDPDKPHTGFIAEEVAEAGFEEYISRGADNEIESVQYPVMVALCVKAIQELSAKVTALEGA